MFIRHGIFIYLYFLAMGLFSNENFLAKGLWTVYFLAMRLRPEGGLRVVGFAFARYT